MKKRLFLLFFLLCFPMLFFACNSNTINPPEATFSTFEKVDNDTYKTIVSNSYTYLKLDDYVDVNEGNIWKVYTDISATQEIPSKIVTLNSGDNVFYVLVTSKDSNVKLYTLQIRRKPLYTISFKTSNGKTFKTSYIEEGSLVSEPNLPENDGYSFVDWNFDFTTPINHSLIVTANYIPNKYNIKYHSNNGLGSFVNQQVEYDSNVFLYNETIFNKEHYNIKNWNTKANGTGTTYSLNYEFQNYNLVKELELYAVWQPNNYNITYYTYGGKTNNKNVYTIETESFVLNDSIKDGYNFEGWYRDSSFNNKVEIISNGSYGNIDLYAKYSLVTYNIEYVLNGAKENNSNNPDSYTIESESFNVYEITRDGYLFKGWYTDSSYTNRIINITPKTNIDLTLYARFEEYKEENLTISF